MVEKRLSVSLLMSSTGKFLYLLANVSDRSEYVSALLSFLAL